MTFVIGLDLGQAQDYTALCVVEIAAPGSFAQMTEMVRAQRSQPIRPHYLIRHLNRFDLGTPYPTVAAEVASLIRNPKLGPDPQLVVDATGVGRPVVDLLRGYGLAPSAVSITGGDTTSYENGIHRVPKRELVSRVLVLLQQGRLRIADALRYAPLLKGELENFRVKVDPLTAHDSYNAREGQHDDLVLAVALAIWRAVRWNGDVYDLPSSPLTPQQRASLEMETYPERRAEWLARERFELGEDD